MISTGMSCCTIARGWSCSGSRPRFQSNTSLSRMAHTYGQCFSSKVACAAASSAVPPLPPPSSSAIARRTYDPTTHCAAATAHRPLTVACLSASSAHTDHPNALAKRGRTNRCIVTYVASGATTIATE